MAFSINSLVPELWCSDFEQSLSFYTQILGFSVVQRKGTAQHAYLELQGSQIMIASWKQDGTWEPAVLEKPYGRGINFQLFVNNVHEIYQTVTKTGFKPFVDLYTMTYWTNHGMDERTEFGLLDPDGYLLRFSQRSL